MVDWIEQLVTRHSALQTVVALSLICAIGLACGKIRVFGVSLGIAFVFFIGIIAGHLGLSVDPAMLDYAESFGLIIFVYTLGLHVGPGFFSSMKHEGMAFNAWGLGLIGVGTALALVLSWFSGVRMSDMVGLLCGATTNTPALGAAQQTLLQVGQSSARAALACAVAYPLGVVGVIFAIMVLRKWVVRPSDLTVKLHDEDNHTHIDQFVVVNPALDGKTVAEVARSSHLKFIISRIWRQGEVILPLSSTRLISGDNVLIITNVNDVDAIEILFGEKVKTDWNADKIDWNAIDAKIESKMLVVTRAELNGKHLGTLKLRQAYGVNVSRVLRGDITLLATEDLRLQYGDRLMVVGTSKAIDSVESALGNSVKMLHEPNLAAIFIGLVLGLALGTLPLSLPGMSIPVKLGIAGGPIIVGILVGAFGSRFHLITYTTNSASFMLRKLGLSLYLACLGLSAGRDFLETVVRPEGLVWIGIGFVLTVVPVVLIGWLALRRHRYDFGTVCGILCGAMANPMALSYVGDIVESDTAPVSYASVYPLSMFVRVIIAQVLVMFFAA